MSEAAADAFRGKREGGEIVVEFGQAAAPGRAADAQSVVLSHRIAMPPETARRLAIALEECLRSPALRSAESSPPSALQAADLRQRGETPVNAPADEAGEQAALLTRLVGDLGVPYQHERSFQLSAHSLLANRFLLTIDRRDVRGDARERVLEIGRHLQMPEALRSAAAQSFDIARVIHFGFEAGPDRRIVKLYLERAIPADEARQALARAEGLLQHLAFKWDTLDGAQVVTKYLWYPAAALGAIEQRLARLYDDRDAGFSLAAARAVLHLAAARTPVERLQYLEVQEDETERRSFDLNVYAAGLQLKDVQRELYRMREHYQVRPGQFQALYDQVKARAFGHLAGGVHRNGRDFFNVYYGVAGWPRFAESPR